MKQYFVIVVSLTFIANSQCGFIDGLLGTVKDTTNSITHNIGGALHYGKSFVFGSSETNATGYTVAKPGIVGTVSLKIHDVSQTVREEVRSIFSIFDNNQNQGNGFIGRLFDRVKCRIFKIKSFLSGHSLTHAENKPNAPVKLNNDTKVLCDKLRKYFFKNNKSGNSGIKQALQSLNDAINRIHNNITKRQDSGDIGNGEEEDGAGSIDIRASAINLAGGVQDDFENGIDAGYDKVQEGIDEGLSKANDSMNKFKQNSDNFIENQKRNVQHNLNNLGNDANKFKNDVDNSMNDLGNRFRDESEKVKGLMENGYSKVDFKPEGDWGSVNLESVPHNPKN